MFVCKVRRTIVAIAMGFIYTDTFYLAQQVLVLKYCGNDIKVHLKCTVEK